MQCDPPVLSIYQAQVVEAIYSHWTKTRSWLTLGRLVALMKHESIEDVDQILRSLPPSSIRHCNYQDFEPVKLGIRGASFCPSSEKFVGAFIGLQRKAAALFIADPNSRPEISSIHLKELLPELSPEEFIGASDLIFEDVEGGGSTAPDTKGDWKKFIGFGSLRFEHLTSIEEWIQLKSEVTEEVDVLQPIHLSILRDVYAPWRDTGSWPDFYSFLVSQRTKGNIVNLVAQIPRPHFIEQELAEPKADNRLELRLSLEGVLATGVAEQDLKNMVECVQFAYDHFMAPDGGTPIGEERLIEGLSLNSKTLARIGYLLNKANTGAWFQKQPTGMSMSVSSRITKYSGIATVEDFIGQWRPSWRGRWREEVLRGPIFTLLNQEPIPLIKNIISASQPTSLIGFQLGSVPVEIVELIGSGGSADVYKGKVLRNHTGLPPAGSPIAVKVTKDWLLEADKIEETRLRVQREGSLSGKPHENVITTYGAHEELLLSRQRPYVLLELVRGVTLKQWVNLTRAASLAQFASFILPVIEALQFLHSKDIVHRDVKPSNVMIGEGKEGRSILLMDLGIAHFKNEEEVTSAYAFMGTWRRAAPEFLFRNPPEGANKPPVDIYALGTLAYDLITGAEFFGDIKNDAEIVLAVKDIVPDISNPDYPKEILSLVREMLSKDPLRRPSLLKVAATIKQYLGSEKTPESQTSDFNNTAFAEVKQPHGDIRIRPAKQVFNPSDPLMELHVPIRLTTHEKKATLKSAAVSFLIGEGIIKATVGHYIKIGPIPGWLPWIIEPEEVHDAWLVVQIQRSFISSVLRANGTTQLVRIEIEDQRNEKAIVSEKKLVVWEQ